MSTLRQRRPRHAGAFADDLGAIDEKREADFNCGRKFMELVLRSTPYSVFFVHLVLFYYICLSPSASSAPATELGVLLAAVASALEEHNITYWLAPGAELLRQDTKRASFTPYHRSLTLGVLHGRSLDVVLALAEMHSPAVSSVETHAGLRVFAAIQDQNDSIFDFREPFLDLHYYRPDGALYVNFCCSCTSTQVSACTKKLCGCLVCAAHRDSLFPLSLLRITGVSRAVPVPHHMDVVLLRRDAADLHPLSAVTLKAAS